MRQCFGRLVKATSGQGLYPITHDVRAWVAQQSISRGLLTLWCRHTSASLLVQANADIAAANGGSVCVRFDSLKMYHGGAFV
jgi:thiamine phosphate synthase YjbQ (UPF0047 family)